MTPRRIVVSGMIASDPTQGGAAWAVLQYVLGLRRLGHRVTFVEPVDALTPTRVTTFNATVAQFGLTEAATLFHPRSRATAGPGFEQLLVDCSHADVLINISGMLRTEELVEPIPIRIYLDLDPGFNQLWATADGIDMGFADHTHFVTVGQRIGTAGCDVPDAAASDWIHSLPPVVLERWPTWPRRGSALSPPSRTGAPTARSRSETATTARRRIRVRRLMDIPQHLDA